MKPKVVVVLGPTATGKSDLAVKIAKKYNGEVISADSRQVYRGLDIGTGKITPDTKNSSNFSIGQAKKEGAFMHKKIPHYLIDVVSPSKVFTVVDWKKETEKKMLEIISRRKLPIICGGTGFYIQSIVDGIVLPEVPPNKRLRKKLEKKSLIELNTILKKLDPERLKTVDRNNPVRLIRAIEIATALGNVPKLKKQKSPYQILQIGLKLSDNEMKTKIYERLISRIKKGMIQEAENLHKNGLSFKRMRELGLEYRYLAYFLEKKQPLKASSGRMTKNKKDFIKKLETEIWRYSKRQRLWFKRDKKIKWFSPKNLKEIEKEIHKFLD